MAAYAMLTRLSPEALARPESVIDLNRQVEDRIKQECPGVRWLANYAVLGPCDYLDIFEAPDVDTATKVSLLVRSFGHATTETWLITPWERFVDLAKGLKS
ncbi:MAG TPA: GYD domain-containing protein [Alphaproteobacteria bacterium]|nr:GYD domain-containing protein [Alphaproteobacteria bacterium]